MFEKMIVTIQFDNSKEEDINLEKVYIKAQDLAFALAAVKDMFRNSLKYDTLSDDVYNKVSALQDTFFDITDSHGVTELLEW